MSIGKYKVYWYILSNSSAWGSLLLYILKSTIPIPVGMWIFDLVMGLTVERTYVIVFYLAGIEDNFDENLFIDYLTYDEL